MVNSANNDPTKNGKGKNAQREHWKEDLPAGKKDYRTMIPDN